GAPLAPPSSIPKPAQLGRKPTNLSDETLDERRDVPNADDVVRRLPLNHRLDPVQVRRRRRLIDRPRLVVRHANNDSRQSTVNSQQWPTEGARSENSRSPPAFG